MKGGDEANAAWPTPLSVPLPKLFGAPVEPMPRPSSRRSAWLARLAPEDAAPRIISVELGLAPVLHARALKLSVGLPMMERADRHEVVHRVVAAQSRRHDVVHAEPIAPAADNAGVPIPPAHRGADPLPLAGVEVGTGGAVTPTHARPAPTIRMAGSLRPLLIQG
jgi:hypothetical protein